MLTVESSCRSRSKLDSSARTTINPSESYHATTIFSITLKLDWHNILFQTAETHQSQVLRGKCEPWVWYKCTTWRKANDWFLGFYQAVLATVNVYATVRKDINTHSFAMHPMGLCTAKVKAEIFQPQVPKCPRFSDTSGHLQHWQRRAAQWWLVSLQPLLHAS